MWEYEFNEKKKRKQVYNLFSECTICQERELFHYRTNFHWVLHWWDDWPTDIPILICVSITPIYQKTNKQTNTHPETYLLTFVLLFQFGHGTPSYLIAWVRVRNAVLKNHSCMHFWASEIKNNILEVHMFCNIVSLHLLQSLHSVTIAPCIYLGIFYFFYQGMIFCCCCIQLHLPYWGSSLGRIDEVYTERMERDRVLYLTVIGCNNGRANFTPYNTIFKAQACWTMNEHKLTLNTGSTHSVIIGDSTNSQHGLAWWSYKMTRFKGVTV